MTRSPITGAARPLTEGLLRETYLAPRRAKFDVAAALADRPAPWTNSLPVAPEATLAAVERALHIVMRAIGLREPEAERRLGIWACPPWVPHPAHHSGIGRVRF